MTSITLMATPIGIDDERFPELAQPMSTRAHLFIAAALKGAQGTLNADGQVVLSVRPADGQAYHDRFCDQLSACMRNRGWDFTCTQNRDFSASVTLTSPDSTRLAARIGATFPESEKLAGRNSADIDIKR